MFADDTPLPEGPDPIKYSSALEKELVLTERFEALAARLDRKNKLQTDDLDCIGAFVVFNSAVARDRCVGDFKELARAAAVPRCFQNLPEPLLFGDDKSGRTVLKVVAAPPPEDGKSICSPTNCCLTDTNNRDLFLCVVI
jgi:hypothetical protein